MKIYICDRCGKQCSYNEIKMPFLNSFELCPDCAIKLDELIEAFFKGGKNNVGKRYAKFFKND